MSRFKTVHLCNLCTAEDQFPNCACDTILAVDYCSDSLTVEAEDFDNPANVIACTQFDLRGEG